MSNYNLLKTISKKYQGKEVYEIAADLGICIKTEEDSKKDFWQSNPLENRSAVLTFAGNQYVIYYKPDKNEKFYILHEICHYILKHNSDGDVAEDQANILACMILIPQKELKGDMLILSYEYNIPPHIVYKYIPSIRNNEKPSKIFFSLYAFVILLVLAILTVVLIFVFNQREISHIPQTTETTTKLTTEYTTELTTEQTTTENTTFSAQQSETVYITKSGKKYHKSDCFYISGRSVRALTVTEAEQYGYSPCSVCFNGQ